MESRNRLGIYIREDRATVVCLAAQGREGKLLEAFSISAEKQGQGLQALADSIAQACAERGIKAAEASVALDCALFMQHSIHSEFSDYKKVAATVRFDTEEALATDISDMAVAFRIIAAGDDGASLDVFTAERSILSDILLSLQSNGIDPVAVRPDVFSLSRYLGESGDSAARPEGNLLCALLSDSRGYLVGGANPRQVSMMRAFMVAPAQDRKALLGREVLVTAALGGSDDSGQKMCVLDASGQLTGSGLAQSVPLEVVESGWIGLEHAGHNGAADCANLVDFAIAYGAALPELEKEDAANFRNDHMPYLGKKRRLEKAGRILSISVAILFLALGVYMQSKLMRVNRDRAAVREKLEPAYLAMMPGKERLPETMRGTVQSLQSAWKQIDALKRGGGDKETVSAKLTMVLKGLNECADKTDLNIDTVTINPQSILIDGDTSNRTNTRQVFDSMRKVGLVIVSERFQQKGDRDAFTIAVEPK